MTELFVLRYWETTEVESDAPFDLLRFVLITCMRLLAILTAPLAEFRVVYELLFLLFFDAARPAWFSAHSITL